MPSTSHDGIGEDSISISFPPAKRLALPSRPPRGSYTMDAPTPSLTSDNDIDREETSPEEPPPSTPPSISRAFYRVPGDEIHVDEQDGSHAAPDAVMCNPVEGEHGNEASSFIRAKPQRPRPNIFDRRLPTSPFPDKSPRRPKPPSRATRVVEKLPQPDRNDDVSDGEDPLSLSFSSLEDSMTKSRPRRPDKDNGSVQSGSRQSSFPPRTASPSASSFLSASSQQTTQPSRPMTLQEEIQNAVNHRPTDVDEEEDMESGILVGVGTRSKRQGFLAHGGAGGIPVFMGVGYVEGAEAEDVDPMVDDSYIPPRARTSRRR